MDHNFLIKISMKKAFCYSNADCAMVIISGNEFITELQPILIVLNSETGIAEDSLENESVFNE